MDFVDRLAAHRAQERQLQWRGTFREYLSIVREQPRVARTAHARIYDMIVSHGVEMRGGHRHYTFFKNELFGIDATLERLVEEYFHSAARRLDVRKRILLLMGPVSGGKSTLVTLLKRGLEAYSRTQEGAIYGIAGCPMHEEPLHLIPAELRPEFEQEYGVSIEGELCPHCRMMLETVYENREEEIPVERVILSEADRIGIGTFTPSDPKSQDIADLTGSIDFATITEYGSESDPRAYRFDGELNKANRGLMEFQEMLKLDEKFLWNLLSLTQEGNFKAGRFALISADECIVAHTNQAEYERFIADKKNEALQSRMIVLPVPYTLSVHDEVSIYQKLIQNSEMQEIHIAPHALEVAAMFSVLTRLQEPKQQGIDLLTKMRLYDGQAVEGYRDMDVEALHHEYPDEGMSGIDPRYVVNRISTALVETDTVCINAIDVLRTLRDGLATHPTISAKDRERYQALLNLVRQRYDEIAKTEVQKAFVYSFEESAKTLFENYLDNIEAYTQHQQLRDPVTDELVEPDEKLMRAIEEQIGVTENQKRAFREEVMIRLTSYARRGLRFDYRSHERLREAIEAKLFADLKDVVKITTSAKTPDPQQLKKINEVSDRLIAEGGYCPVCANALLRYTGTLLNR